jgi:hypothetical protein
MWKTVGASVQGTSHTKNNTPCQDFSGFRDITIREKRVTLIALADGAGSAKHSEEGSKFVVTNWLEAAESFLTDTPENDEKISKEIAFFIRSNLIEYVEGKAGSLGDYACTLLTAIVFEDRTYFFQVGDGAWVYRADDSYGCATWPYQGEFAGETIFLTSKSAPDHFQVALVEKVDAIAGFTDGLERLALKMATKEASAGFFDSMFERLTGGKVEEVEGELRAFLNSERLNERTDDDKTLVLTTKKPGEDGL